MNRNHDGSYNDDSAQARPIGGYVRKPQYRDGGQQDRDYGYWDSDRLREQGTRLSNRAPAFGAWDEHWVFWNSADSERHLIRLAAWR
jgi:hypothetical protein